MIRAPVLVLALTAVSTACIPWSMGETAETLAPGAVRVGVATTALAPPDRLTDLLPVPQLRLTAGVADGLDAAATWVPPLTAHVRLRARLTESRRWAWASSTGLGIQGVPDVVESGERFGVPFLTAQLQVSQQGAAPRGYGSLRAIIPAHLADPAAVTVWLAPQAGVELGSGRLRWGGELGVVVPTLHPGQTQLTLGLSARWKALP